MGSNGKQKTKKFFTVNDDGWLNCFREWNFSKNKTCCFTGHRPENLPGCASRDSLGFMNMRSTAALHIYELIKNGYNTFIIGMSRGFDIEMGELLLTDKRFAGTAGIICAVPYLSQIDEMRTEREIFWYNRIIDEACAVAVCSEKYRNGCYRTRNQFMVNYSSAVIGYMQSRDFRSGTFQTVNMAQRAGLEMHIMYGSENPQFIFAD